MANTLINLLTAGTTETTSVTFDVEVNAPVSLYLIPADGIVNVAGSSQVIIQRQSGANWINTDALNGSTDPCTVLFGIGTFRAFRPAQSDAVGLDLVKGA